MNRISLVVVTSFLASCVFCGPVSSAQQPEPKAYGGVDPEVRAPEDGKLRIICFGAHPDDAELKVGGSAMLWNAQGHHVALVSATNGDIGHWSMAGAPLALRRYEEVQNAAKILGTTSFVRDVHDGELLPSLENRRDFIRLIRRWNADIVIGHRTNDYHPDHRYCGILVQDSAYMVGVPNYCPEVPALRKTPVFLYAHDNFQKPNPFAADIVVAIDEVIEKKIDALLCMESQFVEGGVSGYLDPRRTSNDPAVRETIKTELRERFRGMYAKIADQSRQKLIEFYGTEAGGKVQYAEAFEICEYGRRPTAEEIRQLFPFFAGKK